MLSGSILLPPAAILQLNYPRYDLCKRSSVAINNGTALIGAWGDNSDTGAAYVYSSSSSTVNKAAAMPAMLRLLLLDK